MIHPDTEVRWVNDIVGHGLFASKAIAAGTMTYVWDPLELEIWPDDARLTDLTILDVIERYSYIDGRGVRILSWDNAKYVNHSCNPNSLSTGYGFEIAVRDIAKGEQVTDDYGLFNLPTPMEINCGELGCRGRVTGEDLDLYWEKWDQMVRPALDKFHSVSQPLARHLDESTTRQLRRYAEGKEDYLSVYNLRISKA